MNRQDQNFSVAALYRFAPWPDHAAHRARLARVAQARGVKGTLLLAAEGINGTIAGPAEGIAEVVSAIRGIEGFGDVEVKYSTAREMPFGRLKVRLKREIVTMGVAGVDPLQLVGTYVAPRDWNDLIRDPGTLVIDTRNGYEVGIGTFEGAVDPGTRSFREFPRWIEERLGAGARPERIAMFCTGGIRCEKATAYVKALGFDAVYHLKGGILAYLEQVPATETAWQGACYVFDERVAVGHGLAQAPFRLCHGCGSPVEVAEGHGGGYVDGCCAACSSRDGAE